VFRWKYSLGHLSYIHLSYQLNSPMTENMQKYLMARKDQTRNIFFLYLTKSMFLIVCIKNPLTEVSNICQMIC
jgi:hypothetical protein